MCLGLNYVDHIKEGGYDILEYLVIFMRGPKSLMPAGAPMIRPLCSEQLDYKAELMVIIGKGGKHISESEALDNVFGHTTFDDGAVANINAGPTNGPLARALMEPVLLALTSSPLTSCPKAMKG